MSNRLLISISREAAVIISASTPPPRRVLLIALRRGATVGRHYQFRCTRREAVALLVWLEARVKVLSFWDPTSAEILTEAALVIARATAQDRE
jgi:hypothetical protein